MQRNTRGVPRAVGTLSILALLAAAPLASAQTPEREFYAKPTNATEAAKAAHPPGPTRCVGPIRQVTDIGLEDQRTTAWNFTTPGGGGEGGRFDPVPVLSAGVTLREGCLNAHFSALVGSGQTYPGLAPLALFQVTATPANGAPQHLYGHYETPYGVPAPAVATEAEQDVDEHSSNFFQRIGTGPGELPPGNYRIDVWWAGAGGPGGARAAAFVLKLYLN